MLIFKDVSCRIAGKSILEEINFQIDSKQHVGLIGRNGAGKTTLFKLIEKCLEADSGKILVENGCKILSIKQDIPHGNISVRNYILSQDKEREGLLHVLEDPETPPEQLGEVYEKLLDINAFDAEARAAVVLRGLGFSEEQQNMPLDSFSGGYKMRIALAGVIYQEPDLLLLDEPTNHLDLETSDWLKEFLKKYPKSFILISHDRDFLNSTINYVLHLKNKHITKYTGNFDTFLENYVLKQKNIEAYNTKMSEKRQHMMKFVSRFQFKATKAKQAQSRLKMIEKIKFIPLDEQDPTVEFNFPESKSIPSPIISFEKVSLGYGDNIVLKNVSGCILNDDKIAVVGANGNGKTTFAKFLAGELKNRKGKKTISSQINIGFYHQELFQTLNMDDTPYAHIRKVYENVSDFETRAHLGRFGFSGEKAEQKISALSGGEKARLVFATLTLHAPNLLVLDEPTNHLDLEMRESLITTLTNYNGAVVIISHDRHFLNRVASSIFIVSNGGVTQFNGDLEQYENEVYLSRSK